MHFGPSHYHKVYVSANATRWYGEISDSLIFNELIIHYKVEDSIFETIMERSLVFNNDKSRKVLQPSY